MTLDQLAQAIGYLAMGGLVVAFVWVEVVAFIDWLEDRRVRAPWRRRER